jgi:hypothetical protein
MVNNCAVKAAHFFIACQANPATKVKVTKAMWVKGYSGLEAKETTNMTGRRRGPLPFEAMKMRIKEELVACSISGAR